MSEHKAQTMAEQLQWQTTTEEGRLDVLLAQHYPDYSRSYFHKLIERGCVVVQGVVVIKPRHMIKLAQAISVTLPPPDLHALEAVKVDFEIIDQQPEFMVINKPAGLIVHPAPSAPGEITLVHGLLHSFSEINDIDSPERPGIVHRLDKDTSGLLLVARNEKSQFKLSTMFKDRMINKKYIAVVKGHTPRKGTIDYPIGRHPIHRYKMSHQGQGSRSALTHYVALEYFEGHTLVEVTIVTGRTHQIRVHMAAIGSPVIGDSVYGTSSTLIGRQALHASSCAFDYDGMPFKYSCPLPEDMKTLISNLVKTESVEQL